jgi:hypothetical protein
MTQSGYSQRWGFHRQVTAIMPKWLREFLVTVGVVAITLTIFAVAIALGFFVSIQLAQGSFWMGVAVAISFLVFVVLPLRLWWVSRKARQS